MFKNNCPENAMIERAAVLSCVLFLQAALTNAQTNAEVNAGIQFNFSTPGAHSLAVGGAFLALADDASAAYTNPAGLVGVVERGITIEGRKFSYSNTFTNKGRLEGEATGSGLDTIEGLSEGVAKSSTDGLSFISVVVPGKNWSAALYRHELVNFRTDFQAEGAFLSDTARLLPTKNTMSVHIVGHGVSAGFSGFGDKRLSLGLGISYYAFSINAITRRYNTGFGTGGIYRSLNFSDANVLSTQIQNGEDSDVGITCGFLWKVSESLSVAAVYRQGPEFDFAIANLPGPRAFGGSTPHMDSAHFDTPDFLGVGLALSPRDSIRITVDYNQIRYSELTGSVEDIFGSAGVDRELDEFTVDDAEEFHFGVEYILSRHRLPTVALRFGAWNDPDHRIRFEGQRASSRALFRRGDSETHLTAGLGIGGKRLQLDAAFDHSDRASVFSLSATHRF